MKDFIEQKIVELQNAKTATEITQCANYFINILAENARLSEQMKQEKHRADLADEALKWSIAVMRYEFAGHKTIIMACNKTVEAYVSKSKMIEDVEQKDGNIYDNFMQQAEARLSELEAQNG